MFLVLALVLMVASPALASECQVLTIDHSYGTPRIEARTGTTDILTSINGSFLWVSEPVDGFDSDSEAIASVDVSDPSVIEATACLDGSVTLTREEVSEPDQVSEPSQTVIDWRAIIQSLIDVIGNIWA
jgi:hypothetical protein